MIGGYRGYPYDSGNPQIFHRTNWKTQRPIQGWPIVKILRPILGTMQLSQAEKWFARLRITPNLMVFDFKQLGKCGWNEVINQPLQNDSYHRKKTWWWVGDGLLTNGTTEKNRGDDCRMLHYFNHINITTTGHKHGAMAKQYHTGWGPRSIAFSCLIIG